jgi:AbrB family looped-hinge helix DNA binding protein
MPDSSKGKICGTATVGEKGQVVIPAEIRKKYKIIPGEKLIVFARPGMIGFMRAEGLSHFIDQATQMLAETNKDK